MEAIEDAFLNLKLLTRSRVDAKMHLFVLARPCRREVQEAPRYQLSLNGSHILPATDPSKRPCDLKNGTYGRLLFSPRDRTCAQSLGNSFGQDNLKPPRITFLRFLPSSILE